MIVPQPNLLLEIGSIIYIIYIGSIIFFSNNENENHPELVLQLLITNLQKYHGEWTQGNDSKVSKQQTVIMIICTIKD